MLHLVINSPPDLITSRWCVEQLKTTLHFLLYHRLQIPVPYPTLSLLVDQIKRDEVGDRPLTNFFLTKQRRIALDTYQNVQSVVLELEKQIIQLGIDLNYAAITFGPTPVLAKEVWFLKLPLIDRQHKNENHLANLQRTVSHTVLSLATDPRLASVLNATLPLTNMHVLLKETTTACDNNNSAGLEEIEWLELPRSCKTFLIQLDQNSREERNPKNSVTCSCVETEIHIFNDLCGLEVQCQQMTINEETVECEESDGDSPPELTEIVSGRWLQLDTVVKGFNDVLSNGQKIWSS